MDYRVETVRIWWYDRTLGSEYFSLSNVHVANNNNNNNNNNIIIIVFVGRVAQSV